MQLLNHAGRLLAAIHDHLAVGEPVPTMDKLAAEVGVTTRTVQATMVDLREASLIATEKVGRRVVYQVTAHDSLADAVSLISLVERGAA